MSKPNPLTDTLIVYHILLHHEPFDPCITIPHLAHQLEVDENFVVTILNAAVKSRLIDLRIATCTKDGVMLEIRNNAE